MRRVGTSALLVAVLMMVAAACGESFEAGELGAVEVAEGEEIQIRSIGPITGDVAFLGVPNLRGVEMAVSDYGPVEGWNVSIGTPMDGLCSPDGGQAAGQAVVADPQDVYTQELLAAAPRLEGVASPSA